MLTVAAAIHKFWVESAQHPDIQNPFLGGFTLTTNKNSSTHKTLEQLHLRADLSSSRREFDSLDDTTEKTKFTVKPITLLYNKKKRADPRASGKEIHYDSL